MGHKAWDVLYMKENSTVILTSVEYLSLPFHCWPPRGLWITQAVGTSRIALTQKDTDTASAREPPKLTLAYPQLSRGRSQSKSQSWREWKFMECFLVTDCFPSKWTLRCAESVARQLLSCLHSFPGHCTGKNCLMGFNKNIELAENLEKTARILRPNMCGWRTRFFFF